MQYLTILLLNISIQPYGSLLMSLFRKETAGKTILRANSAHPTTLIKSIPYGQYHCIKQNCSSPPDFEKEASALKDRLLTRRYSKKCLKKPTTRHVNIHGLNVSLNVRYQIGGQGTQSNLLPPILIIMMLGKLSRNSGIFKAPMIS